MGYRGRQIILKAGKELRNERIRTLTPAEKWTRIALRLLVADCPYRPVLCVMPGVPFTDKQLAKHLMVSMAVWKRVKKILVDWGDIEVDSKVGIRYKHYKVDLGYSIHRRGINPDPKELPVMSSEELRKHEDIRGWLIDRFNIITGSEFHKDEMYFVSSVEGRIEEGATREDLDIGMRTFLWIYLNSPVWNAKYIKPFRPFSTHSFWKWVNTNMPAAVVKNPSTSEYILSLPHRVRKLARKCMSEYIAEMRLVFRRHGWEQLSDVDFTKVKTCRQYIMERVEKEIL